MGLDQKSNYNLWKDRVAVEVNTAILHSFRIAGVSIVDQHTVSEQFQTHLVLISPKSHEQLFHTKVFFEHLSLLTVCVCIFYC